MPDNPTPSTIRAHILPGLSRLKKIYLAGLLFSILFLALQSLLLVSIQSGDARTSVNLSAVLVTSLVSVSVLGYTAWQTRLLQPKLFPSWLMLALAMLCNPLAGILGGLILLLDPGFDYISFVNFFILIVYPLYLLIVALFPSSSTRKLELIQWLFDAMIVVLSITLIYWVFIIQPDLLATHKDQHHLIYSVASQIGDLLIIWALLMLLFRRLQDQRVEPVLWLFAGFLFLLIYDLITASVSSSFSTSSYGSLKEVILNASILFLTMAGLQQLLALKNPIKAASTRPSKTDWWEIIRLAMPYLGLGASFTLLISSIISPKSSTTLVIAVWVAIILLMVIIRQVLVIRENQRLSGQLFELNAGLEQRVAERTEELLAANQELLERENRMAHNAMHDALTDLPNRTLLIDRLAQSILRMRRDPHYLFGVLFMDLDGFKVINDSMGHVAGDKLLVSFAAKLKSCVREIDTVARLGGDEFVILLDGSASVDCLIKSAQRVMKMFSEPFDIENQFAYLAASLGIVPGSPDYDEPSDILRDADLAMYEAKAMGKGCYVLFTPALSKLAMNRLLMEKDLRLALEKKELYLNYQPIINLVNGSVSGFEALLRWRHHSLGMISPGIFIPIAESNGMITPITFWVFEEAIRQLALWQKEFPGRQLTMSVNLSARLVSQPDLIQNLKCLLSEGEVSPHHLILEITESAIIQNAAIAIKTLQECQKMGIKVHMDDFGTGYSSLSYLHSFPINALKIAQDFVIRILPGGENSEIVQTIFNLARNLDLEVIAEGIETPEQMDFICKLGCQGGQGFFISRPLAPEDAARFAATYSFGNHTSRPSAKSALQ
jgi:diguanylate cyclase (GGDEF)-like protein